MDDDEDDDAAGTEPFSDEEVEDEEDGDAEEMFERALTEGMARVYLNEVRAGWMKVSFESRLRSPFAYFTSTSIRYDTDTPPLHLPDLSSTSFERESTLLDLNSFPPRPSTPSPSPPQSSTHLLSLSFTRTSISTPSPPKSPRRLLRRRDGLPARRNRVARIQLSLGLEPPTPSRPRRLPSSKLPSPSPRLGRRARGCR